ncbi:MULTISPECIES: class I SAM-dependent methyltransferase [unclassified Mesorhizobium]|uniref:class I SAM-dependent methyltransferase n=1 Tax=unclassified Mesorhizobium TaxID=325217 RepID=UPI000F756303|nr:MULTISPECIES: class I SAM-dependent methyltransferase [unclassified Mesorhizobium]AZO05096.1 methyltransferase domain-containing protein [Mesorhizobium sp. M2A.F.Ca.ET.043.02.1.1]RWB42936.1 MAG: methyltransferase domain-containing protein [Mesorhizobium sp.]RWB64940.1 MAG: methyltransferase domain-containing protein [Mesorhizobium sp.]RWB88100.1 MAG: methyltransferase domain-containing protein [Mesorhizobium sp.]RWC16696.1 MAG: methyltransferase domain-containing protein [Mesorhizobium sp.]
MSPYDLLPRFKVQYDANNQEFSISGVIRPQAIDELGPSLALLRDAIGRVRGVLYINVRRLTQMNNAAFHAFSRIIIDACRALPDLKFVVITSSVVGWTSRKFGRLSGIEPNITVEEYDSEFYPGQGFLEEGGFVPILRTQTKLTWRHERAILPRHGMRPGIVMADICCGIGDFAVLVQKEFQPSRIVALDHSISSLNYARRVMREFDIRGIEYTYGDASEMLLDEAQFDLVTCRHSLQIFNRPELILKELYRICQPGGRVYITNEKNSHCLGEPRAESIRWTYNEVAKLFAHFEMDVELGPKSRRYLIEAGFEDIRVETFMVTNMDGDPQDFADVIMAWADVYAGDMASRRGDGPEFVARFRQGFQDHIFAALHPKGYAGWPIWVASGRRPQ